MSSDKQLGKMYAKIHEYKNSERIEALYRSKFERLDKKFNASDKFERLVGVANAVDSIGTMQACFAVSDLIEEKQGIALTGLIEGFYRHIEAESALQLFRQFKSFEGVLARMIDSHIVTLCTGILIDNQAQTTWFAESIVKGYQAEDDWVDDDSYLVSMLYLLALSYTNERLSMDDEADIHPLVSALFESDDLESTKAALAECCEHRFKAAYQAQVKVKDNEYLNYALAGLPFEILAFEVLYNRLNHADLMAEHCSILPQFREIYGKDTGYTDEAIEQLKRDAASL